MIDKIISWFKPKKKSIALTKQEVVAQSLIEHYYDNFCEDPIDGTLFDCKVMDKIREIEKL